MKKILELHTPRNTEIDDFIAHLAQRDDTDTIMLEEGGGLSVIIVAEKLRRICDKEIILKIACRDRNRIALHSQIITADFNVVPARMIDVRITDKFKHFQVRIFFIKKS